ncbi:MAG TPA: P63C domain-containing protein [Acidobacteriaceae bacterium]|nr:P63C domain-containing protein [Acidobacteriaceae bacterium]
MPQSEVNGRAKGAVVLAESMTQEERTSRAKKAASVRWEKRKGKLVASPERKLPLALYKGVLELLGDEIPCYVLDSGQRVIGRTAFTEALTKIKGGGDLEKYLGVSSLKPFIKLDMVLEGMVAFSLPEVEGLARDVKGLPADLAIEVWRGFVSAMEASLSGKDVRLTERQREMAIRASFLLGACAKVGLDALIDEATGYQYDRAADALRVKLKAYLADEMRDWESTFPQELWLEFGRLTNWKGTVTQRPKYWGILVTELVYSYLDADVCRWLKENKPHPQKGRNWHQWLSEQYGLRKLIQHIYTLIGVAKTCQTMRELRDKMAEMYGKTPVQLRLYLPQIRSES